MFPVSKIISKKKKLSLLVFLFTVSSMLAKGKHTFVHRKEGNICTLAIYIFTRTLYFCDYILRVVNGQID